MVGRDDKIIKSFADKVRIDYPDAKIILFGSRARGDALKNSDYDIVVISKYFEGKKTPEIMSKLSLLWDFDEYRADIIPYTPEKFDEWSKYLTIAKKAKEEGLLI